MTTKTPGRQIIEMIQEELEEVLKEGMGGDDAHMTATRQGVALKDRLGDEVGAGAYQLAKDLANFGYQWERIQKNFEELKHIDPELAAEVAAIRDGLAPEPQKAPIYPWLTAHPNAGKSAMQRAGVFKNQRS